MQSTQELTIDVKDLLSIDVNYGKLSAVLSAIITRLDGLERTATSAPAPAEAAAPVDRDASSAVVAPPPPPPPQHESTVDLKPLKDKIARLEDDVSTVPKTLNDFDRRLGGIESQLSKLRDAVSSLPPRETEPSAHALALQEKAGPPSEGAPTAAVTQDEGAPTAAVTQDEGAPTAALTQDESAPTAAKTHDESAPAADQVKHSPSPLDDHSDTSPRLRQLESELGKLRDRIGALESAPREGVPAEILALPERVARLEELVDTGKGQSATPVPPAVDVVQLENRVRALEDGAKLDDKAPATVIDNSAIALPVTDDLRPDVHELQKGYREVRDALQGITTLVARIKEKQDSAPTAPADKSSAPETSVAPPPPSSSNEALIDALSQKIAQIKDEADAAIADLAGRLAELKNAIDGILNRPPPSAGPPDALAGHKDHDAALAAGLQKTLQDHADALAGTKKILQDHDEALRKLLQSSGTKQENPPAAMSTPLPSREALDGKFEEIYRLLSQQNGKISELRAKQQAIDVPRVDSSAAPLHDLAAKLADLEQRLAQLADKVARDPQRSNATGETDARISQLLTDAVRDRDWANQQVIEIRATIDHIHHTKADTSQVANKADRDYVENALEKLMREVEQVLNTTNAGLIDTLDKSLGILRDMIDGKASKADLARMKAMSNEEVGVVPEGLTGYKSYRCLGCNRTVDAMRTRPMGANFSNFMNRLPTSPRQPPRTADEGVKRPAALIASSPGAQ